MKEIILKDEDIINFVPFTKEYGMAEFAICPVVKRGKLKEIFIYLLQQENIEHYYRIPTNKNTSSWSVRSWTHKGLSDPKIWIMYWCKEHKCQSFRVYPPKGSTNFSISLLSDVNICFDT